MKEKLMKKINPDFIAIFIFSILVGSVVFFVKFDVNDELWNFSNVYKMCNGYTIYKDLNVITTPLFWYIGELFLKVFGTNYLAFRIYNFVIYICLFFITYKIFNNLKIRKLTSIMYTIIIYFLLYRTFGAGANYNSLAIVFYLLGILLNLKISDNKWYLPYIQGMISFIIFITKQNIGIYYLIGCLIMQLIIGISNKNVKKEIIFAIKQIITFGILCACLICAFIINGNLNDFINFCILGISEFTRNNMAIEIKSIVTMSVIAISIIYSIILIRMKKVDKNIKVNNIKLLPFVIMSMPMAFPIFNVYHVYLASVIGIMLLIYNLDKIVITEILDDKKIEKLCIIVISIITIYHIIFFFYNNIRYYKRLNTYINPYYGSMITEEQIQNINQVCNFIRENEKNGQDVKIVSYKSNLYMNILSKNNGILDLPFFGNLGRYGEEGIINNIAKMKSTKILIQKEDKIFFQESQKVRNYIKENLKYEGEIEEFLIYSK